MQSYAILLPPAMTTPERDALALSGLLPVTCEIVNKSFSPPKRQTQIDMGVWVDSVATPQLLTPEQELWLD